MSATEDIDDADRLQQLELAALIDAAEVDWLREALHAVVGTCQHHQCVLITQILETLRYELAQFDTHGDKF